MAARRLMTVNTIWLASTVSPFVTIIRGKIQLVAFLMCLREIVGVQRSFYKTGFYQRVAKEAGMSSTEAYPLSFRKASTPEFTGGNSVRAPRLASKSILPARSTMRLNWLKSSRFAKNHSSFHR